MEAVGIARTLTEARRCAELGLYQAAWDLIESLPPAHRTDGAAFAVRLLVCAGLQRWEMGIEVARQISAKHKLSEREAAGRFYLSHAEAMSAAGDKRGAKGSIWSLSLVWPEGRELALKTRALAAVW